MKFYEIAQKLNLMIQKQNLNEMAFKNACGVELTQEIVDTLRHDHPQLKPLKSDSLDAKISWLIRYVDTLPRNQLIGLKISEIGKIRYFVENKWYEQNITLAIGDTKIDSTELLPKTNHGLIHMQQGRHWKQSKEALHLLPNGIRDGVVTKGDTQYKYKVKYRFDNYYYVVGVPSPQGDETVLITCLSE